MNEKPYKRLAHDGTWHIYFNPVKRISRVVYAHVEGFIDESEADMLLEALELYELKHKKIEDML